MARSQRQESLRSWSIYKPGTIAARRKSQAAERFPDANNPRATGGARRAVPFPHWFTDAPPMSSLSLPELYKSIKSSLPPTWSPPMKMFGTVRWPVIASSSD
jgi:hypothetical protein